MATLVLGAAGAVLGSALMPSGVSALGLTLTGAQIGAQVGSLAGSFIDKALFGGSAKSPRAGSPRLDNFPLTSAAEGAVIPRVYGRAKVAGHLIWAGDIIEEIGTSSGGGKGARPQASETSTYTYFADIALALTDGEIAGVGRITADTRELDLSKLTWRLHHGRADQLADSRIVAIQGSHAPAYRGLAYIVFERLPLARFGNRIPQFTVEVFRPLDNVSRSIRGVGMIPGTGEFSYCPNSITRKVGRTAAAPENTNTKQASADWTVALDQLRDSHPNANSISLVVSWFGTDLRAGQCQLRPGVESPDKVTSPDIWSVGGLTREAAYLVSQAEGRANYGGTPSDKSVIAAIQDLKARGLSVVLSPFILMDIPSGNSLPSPFAPTLNQPPFPWRGRITCDPAPGVSGSPDQTAAAAAEIAAFVGTAVPAHFSIVSGQIVYSGPAEWSFRRMILHHAFLAKAAGGVDAFVLCSELRGLTQIRSARTTYPFVNALVALAADVRTVLGHTTKLIYSADWTEYFGHQPADGSGDVLFHLDPLWASPHIDAIGLDAYWPLADWRQSAVHLDKAAGARHATDLTYLKSNVRSGEGYDWYYASSQARIAQIRTAITDGTYGKPWAFRTKDIWSWWANAHHNRIAGVEQSAPTAWTPRSKPFWLMEIGCPAVNHGPNQPNVFVDPKSAENALPYFSNGVRDDEAQRRYIQALIETFDPTAPGFVTDNNPLSPLYGGRMVDPARVHVYAWDARPYPAFPDNRGVWADGANWSRGHWITGRHARVGLSNLVAKILDDAGFSQHDTASLEGSVDGYVINRIASARASLEAIELCGFIDSIERDGKIVFRQRAKATSVRVIAPDACVEESAASPLILATRLQEADLPVAAKIAYIDMGADYVQAVAEARISDAQTVRVATAELPIVLDDTAAQSVADTWLHETWAAQEQTRFVLPPSAIALEPGDIVDLQVEPLLTRRVRIIEIADGAARTMDARGFDEGVYRPSRVTARPSKPRSGSVRAAPEVIHLDVPLSDDAPSVWTCGIAAALSPWPGPLTALSSNDNSDFRTVLNIAAPARLGVLKAPLPPGPTSRFDYANTVDIELDAGELSSATRLNVLGGANAITIETASGNWEILQFETAELVAKRRYLLKGLLRGKRGTDRAIETLSVPVGARCVILDDAIATFAPDVSMLGRVFQWRTGPARDAFGDDTFRATAFAYVGRALSPLTPVHVRGKRATNGDLALTWVRRSRVDADRWESAVPLGEATEAYEIDILDSAGLRKRTIASTQPSAIYTAVQQIADFGSLQMTVAMRVFQISASVGRGSGRSATL